MYEVYTGDLSKRPARLFNILGITASLRHCGFPTINPSTLNLTQLKAHWIAWPRDTKTLQPYLTHLAGIRYHYGESLANQQSLAVRMTLNPFSGSNAFTNNMNAISHLIQMSMVIEYRDYLHSRFSLLKSKAEWINIENLHDPLTWNQSQEMRYKVEQILESWVARPEPLNAKYNTHTFLIFY